MSNQKIVHYNIDKIDSVGARINLIYRGAQQWEIVSSEA